MNQTKNNDPKNQHTIPKCYLKQFVDPAIPKNFGPCVWIFERESKIGKRQHIRSVLTEMDVYTFQGSYKIEKSLSQLESEYATIFDKKIKNRLPLEPYEHSVLCAFVAAMLQRTMKQKESIEHMMDQVIEKIKQLEAAHGVPPKTSREWEEAKADAHKLSLVESIPKVANMLSKMNLAFLCSERGVSFITSDAPAYMFNNRLQFQSIIPPSLDQKHVEVRMPLSPKISLCFSWVNNLRGYLVLPEDKVHDSNRMIFGEAHQYFIANSSKLKRRWFQRLPLDPVFLWRYLKNKVSMQIMRFRRRKRHV